MGLWRGIKRRAELIGIRYGYLIPEKLRLWLDRMLFPPGSPKTKQLTIDVIGSCNLRCPSCPVGNMGPLNETGLMPREMFERIVTRAYDEFDVRCVALFNWTEPLLHPHLPEFIRFVKNKGMFCMISSNLNVLRNIDEVLKAGPDWFRISLSGFTQEVYGQTHKHGQIERVKENMRKLSEAIKRLGVKRTMVSVNYHVYKHNIHETEPMRKLAEELGFQWFPSWAYYMPLEKVFSLLDNELSAEEEQFVEEAFALPIRKSLEAAKQFKDFSRCTLLEDQLAINVKGELALCCGVYDMHNSVNKLGNFLDMTREDIERAKSHHPTCQRCGSEGIQHYLTFPDIPKLRDRYDELVAENLKRPKTPASALSLPIVTL
jgi:MoaA/NifB/PqqE/SkfB family radical SAM enzyme